MARERSDRYPTAAALADDVQRYLADEPVSAHHDGLSRRLARWARRHREVAAAAALLLVGAVAALGAGVVFVNRQRAQADIFINRQRAQAEKVQRARAERDFRTVLRAVEDTYTLVAETMLSEQPGTEKVQRDFLEGALKVYQRLAEQSGGGRAARAEVANSGKRVGDILSKLEDRAGAEAAYRRAVAVAHGLYSEEPANLGYRALLASCQYGLAVLLTTDNHFEEAERLHGEALGLRESPGVGSPLDLAESLNALHDLAKREHRLTDAEAHLKRAIGLLDGPGSGRGGSPAQRRMLARLCDNRAILLKDLGDPTRFGQAEALCQQGLDLRRALLREAPRSPVHRRDLALSLSNLGVLIGKFHPDPAAMGSLYEKAIRLQEALADDYPRVTAYRAELARTYVNLAVVYSEGGDRTADAEPLFIKGLGIRRGLAEDYPGRADFQRDLARAHYWYARSLAKSGAPRAAEAETAFKDAVVFLENLADRDEAVPAYRAEAAEALDRLALLYRDEGRWKDAVGAAGRAVAHQDAAHLAGPATPASQTALRGYLLRQAQALARSGQHVDAAAAVARACAIAIPTTQFQQHLVAARVLSQCVPLAGRDADLPEGERSRLARSYADRAVQQLREAVDAGLPNAGPLDGDDFRPLRRRVDYQDLLRDLNARPRD
jgi:tetratricopeptide (TPR) repeat protein